MSGIADLTVAEFQQRINRFDQKYVADWDGWLNAKPNIRAAQFGIVLRKWQACRPNRMRRAQIENKHDAPYIEDLIDQAVQYLQVFQDFDIRDESSFTLQNCSFLAKLWGVFENLSYHGRARNGLAGVVGISKAVLLLTNGRVGPAFDSQVRRHLGLGKLANASQWIDALRTVSRDIQAFESRHQTTLQKAVPRPHGHLQSGRIYDMALGPGG